MAMELTIRAYTNAFRETVDKWKERKVRDEGAERGIPESETLPLVTLRNAIVEDERDKRRAAVAGNRELATGPGDTAGHPGR